MSQMRTSIKIRAGYRPANRQEDGNKRCRNCSRTTPGWKGSGNHATPVINCTLLGITIHPGYICREHKQKET